MRGNSKRASTSGRVCYVFRELIYMVEEARTGHWQRLDVTALNSEGERRWRNSRSVGKG